MSESEEEIEPPRSADVYRRTTPAIAVLSGLIGCDHGRALEILRGLVEAGYFIAPRIPSDPMLYAYFVAYGQQAWSPRTVVQNIGKARLRWQAMGQAGTALALSRRFIRPPQGIEASGEDANAASSRSDESPSPEGGAPDTGANKAPETVG